MVIDIFKKFFFLVTHSFLQNHYTYRMHELNLHSLILNIEALCASENIGTSNGSEIRNSAILGDSIRAKKTLLVLKKNSIVLTFF